ncbi:hypothetical protein BegalDRAFT_1814 [Beggiatoa alba B18LD]|uniref:Transcription factor zinc-finger domain-containing protein n=1 Tax=Beggiatoa alba B18LD TaxID=395493 RepID=I3CGE5_9GAMM|nr:zf-TFIIB domain-containing protein [Beggiatoa alba]EIJ42688.1 hypothetical protein BegalDRAFT_1814 [Beggiatoa alba B18LD]
MPNCPVCKEIHLLTNPLEDNLIAYHCLQCGGQWIRQKDYQAWLTHKGSILPEKAPSETVPEPLNTKQIKICPDCGHLLLKYQVGKGTDFTLDHCSHCGGVWFDKNEWLALKDRNLHDEVDKIITDIWQKNVRLEASRQTFQTFYLQQFGQADYEEIQRIKAWLSQHPKRDALLNYLQIKDPYSGT